MLAITGATGRLGRLVIDHLLTARAPDGVLALVRDTGKTANLRALGVAVRAAG